MDYRTQEIYEAIYTGERALDSLNAAYDQLGSAGNWGVVDILGGNLISGMMKHTRINDASRYISEAKEELNHFRYELGDIRDIDELHIDIDGFLTFADFFMDGIIADVIVQSRIEDSRRQILNVIHQVEYILDRLEREVYQR